MSQRPAVVADTFIRANTIGFLRRIAFHGGPAGALKIM